MPISTEISRVIHAFQEQTFGYLTESDKTNKLIGLQATCQDETTTYLIFQILHHAICSLSLSSSFCEKKYQVTTDFWNQNNNKIHLISNNKEDVNQKIEDQYLQELQKTSLAYLSCLAQQEEWQELPPEKLEIFKIYKSQFDKFVVFVKSSQTRADHAVLRAIANKTFNNKETVAIPLPLNLSSSEDQKICIVGKKTDVLKMIEALAKELLPPVNEQ